MGSTENTTPRLGVNIDHVATLRQQREEHYPSLVEAARICLESGADQITIHLREDRRHIQDIDVGAIKLVTERFGKPLNLEMGCNEEIIELAKDIKPGWVCLVPEKREEKTTEGGLNLLDENQFKKIKSTMESLRDSLSQTKISLFVEANEEILKKCIELKVDAVEIHTGDYARAHLNSESVESYISTYSKYKTLIQDAGIGYHAGHGLTGASVLPLVKNQLFEEYNIGHWIICEAVFFSLSKVVGNLNNEIKSI
jgi:pyridoxine 5-phosphate synthase